MKQIIEKIQEERYDFCNPDHFACPNNDNMLACNEDYTGCNKDSQRDYWSKCEHGWCVDASGNSITDGSPGIPWCEKYCPIQYGKGCYDKVKCTQHT